MTGKDFVKISKEITVNFINDEVLNKSKIKRINIEDIDTLLHGGYNGILFIQFNTSLLPNFYFEASTNKETSLLFTFIKVIQY